MVPTRRFPEVHDEQPFGPRRNDGHDHSDRDACNRAVKGKAGRCCDRKAKQLAVDRFACGVCQLMQRGLDLSSQPKVGDQQEQVESDKPPTPTLLKANPRTHPLNVFGVRTAAWEQLPTEGLPGPAFPCRQSAYFLSPVKVRSTKVVSMRASENAVWLRISWWSGMTVLIPSIFSSESARCMLAIASARVG